MEFYKVPSSSSFSPSSSFRVQLFFSSPLLIFCCFPFCCAFCVSSHWALVELNFEFFIRLSSLVATLFSLHCLRKKKKIHNIARCTAMFECSFCVIWMEFNCSTDGCYQREVKTKMRIFPTFFLFYFHFILERSLHASLIDTMEHCNGSNCTRHAAAASGWCVVCRWKSQVKLIKKRLKWLPNSHLHHTHARVSRPLIQRGRTLITWIWSYTQHLLVLLLAWLCLYAMQNRNVKK